MSISENGDLVTIRGFPALTEVTNALYIAENPNLTVVEIGGSLASLGDFFVALNPRLTTLEGLESLSVVGGDLTFLANEAIDGVHVAALAEVGGNLILSELPELDVAEFSVLRSVKGTWSVNSTALESLTGFPALEHVGDTVALTSNPKLEEFTMNGPFAAIGAIIIYDNPALERIHGTASVRLNPMTEVSVARNTGLRRLDGFANVNELGGLTLAENGNLQYITALNGLQRVGNSPGLRILRNPVLADFGTFLSGLNSASDVWIFGNSSLSPALVEELIERSPGEERMARIGDNMGEATALDPCLWPKDLICDADMDAFGQRGTELCLTDSEDCGY